VQIGEAQSLQSTSMSFTALFVSSVFFWLSAGVIRHSHSFGGLFAADLQMNGRPVSACIPW
jgi:hypothetical protein